MIISKKKIEEALMYTSFYYDKIIFVDYIKDDFELVKINDKEWSEINPNTPFTRWLEEFLVGDNYYPVSDNNTDTIFTLLDIETMSKRRTVLIFNYYKKIDNEFHIVQLEAYPTEEGKGIIFVRDLTKMKNSLTF